MYHCNIGLMRIDNLLNIANYNFIISELHGSTNVTNRRSNTTTSLEQFVLLHVLTHRAYTFHQVFA